MSDIFTEKKRSEIMSRIRSRGNKATEIRFLTILRRHRITGWRRHAALPGRPDFTFPAQRLAVFVDGCFWHACPKHGALPRNNRPYWRKKLERNRKWDRQVNRALKKAGWHPLRIWEHALRREDAVAARLQAMLVMLK